MRKIYLLIFFFVLIISFLIFRKKERFYSFDDVASLEMINTLHSAVYKILDNSSYTFYGALTPLNFDDYRKKFTIQEGYSSFTENKKKIFLCLKDSNGNIYPFNSLMYVLLHEIAHVINTELHHTKKFQKIFQELLDHAEKLGFYNSKLPFESNYCS